MRCAWMRAWPSVADGPTLLLHPAAPCDPARHGLRAETHLRAQCVDDLLLLLDDGRQLREGPEESVLRLLPMLEDPVVAEATRRKA